MKWGVDLMHEGDFMGGTGYVFDGLMEVIHFIDNFRSLNPLEQSTYYFLIVSEDRDPQYPDEALIVEQWMPEAGPEVREREVRSLLRRSGEDVVIQEELFRSGEQLVVLRHRVAAAGRN